MSGFSPHYDDKLRITRGLLALSRAGHFDLWIDAERILLAGVYDAPDERHYVPWSVAAAIVRRGWWLRRFAGQEHREEVLRRRSAMAARREMAA